MCVLSKASILVVYIEHSKRVACGSNLTALIDHHAPDMRTCISCRRVAACAPSADKSSASSPDTWANACTRSTIARSYVTYAGAMRTLTAWSTSVSCGCILYSTCRKLASDSDNAPVLITSCSGVATPAASIMHCAMRITLNVCSDKPSMRADVIAIMPLASVSCKDIFRTIIWMWVSSCKGSLLSMACCTTHQSCEWREQETESRLHTFGAGAACMDLCFHCARKQGHTSRLDGNDVVLNADAHLLLHNVLQRLHFLVCQVAPLILAFTCCAAFTIVCTVDTRFRRFRLRLLCRLLAWLARGLGPQGPANPGALLRLLRAALGGALGAAAHLRMRHLAQMQHHIVRQLFVQLGYS